MTTTQKLVDDTIKQLAEWTDHTVTMLTALTCTPEYALKVPTEALENVKLLIKAQHATITGLNEYVKSLHEIANSIPR
jgi:phage-related minor tail protein